MPGQAYEKHGPRNSKSISACRESSAHPCRAPCPAPALTSPARLARAMRSLLGDQDMNTTSCGSCFSPTCLKAGMAAGPRRPAEPGLPLPERRFRRGEGRAMAAARGGR